jgi:hypothetical protein
MDRISVGESEDELQRQVETMILRKLDGDHRQMIQTTTEEELKRAMSEAAKYPVYDKALNSLIVSNLVSRIGTDEYQITDNGIQELSSRDQSYSSK